MTAPQSDTRVTDDVGMGGTLLYGSFTRGCSSEVYSYPADLPLETIRDAWTAKYPRSLHFTAVIEERVEAGRRFVRIDRYAQKNTPRLHIDEPNV